MYNSYKLFNHERCNAHVDVYLDQNDKPNGIQLWSGDIIICGWMRTSDGEHLVFSAGSFSKTTRRHISLFSRQPEHSVRDWKLSYQFFMEIREKCPTGMRHATIEETECIYDLIQQYLNNGKESHYVYR